MGQQRLIHTAFLMSLTCGVVACSGGGSSGGDWQNDDLGRLQVALTATAPSGASYTLSNATFEVTNFSVSPPIDLTVSGDDPTLRIDLPASAFPFDYQITLRDGWTLNAVNDDGSLTPLGATLFTSTIPFTIKPQRTTPIAFQFKASEQVVTMGNGTASVTAVVDDSLIDDFEDGDSALAPLGGRNGGWFIFDDGTGTSTPAPGSPIVPEVTDTSASLKLHLAGAGFAPQGPLPDGSFAFGSGVGAVLVVDPSGKVLPYDASKYGGIAFSFNTVSGQRFPLQVSFLVSTTATTPIDQGGICDPATQVCFDDFGFVGFVPPGQFGFSGGFSWGELRQQGFGTPVAFDPATILSIKWIMAFPNFGQTAADDAFDFQLDDVTFTLPGGLTGSRAASAPAPAAWAPGAR